MKARVSKAKKVIAVRFDKKTFKIIKQLALEDRKSVSKYLAEAAIFGIRQRSFK